MSFSPAPPRPWTRRPWSRQAHERNGVLRIASTILAVTFALALTAAAGAQSTPQQAAQHDRQVIAFFLHHPRLAATPAGQLELWRILHRLSVQLRSLQAARAAEPAHLALWRCIEKGESGGDGVHPGSERASNGSHFNVLQMTNPWAGFDPIGLSYSVIERAAEQQYAASGYSRGWLSGQWQQTIGPCWGYAE